MRRGLLIATACAAMLAIAPAPETSAGTATPDRVLVRGTEFNLTLSKLRVRPGRVIVQFLNAGEDPHDLRIRRVGDTLERGVGELPPGEYANLDLRLKQRSAYQLWCSLAAHRVAGMEATLETKAKKRRRGGG